MDKLLVLLSWRKRKEYQLQFAMFCRAANATSNSIHGRKLGEILSILGRCEVPTSNGDEIVEAFQEKSEFRRTSNGVDGSISPALTWTKQSWKKSRSVAGTVTKVSFTFLATAARTIDSTRGHVDR
jgi:hypothetical protein